MTDKHLLGGFVTESLMGAMGVVKADIGSDLGLGMLDV